METLRDEKGRILPGSTGNPYGRPKKKTFRDYFNDEEEEDLINKIKQAIGERPEIMKMVVEHIFGKPTQQVNTDITSAGKPIPLLGGITQNDILKDNSNE